MHTRTGKRVFVLPITEKEYKNLIAMLGDAEIEFEQAIRKKDELKKILFDGRAPKECDFVEEYNSETEEIIVKVDGKIVEKRAINPKMDLWIKPRRKKCRKS